MNYILLKEIISSIVTTFRCQHCGEKPHENRIFIKKADGKSLELSYQCPVCQTKAILSAQLGEMRPEFLKTTQWREMLQKFLDSKQKSAKNPEPTISSEEILNIENILSKNTTVNDLINGEQNS